MKSAALKNAEAPAMPWLNSYPEGVAWDIEIPEQPLFAFLEQTAAKHGAVDAIAFAGHTYTYAALAALVDRAAKGLQTLGVKKGVKVGLFMPNALSS